MFHDHRSVSFFAHVGISAPVFKFFLLVGCFDPKNIFIDNEINCFRGDLTDILAKKKHWWVFTRRKGGLYQK